METAAKIRKYIKQRNVAHLPESIRYIIRKRQEQVRALEEDAKIQIKKAIGNGKFFVCGEMVEIKQGVDILKRRFAKEAT